MTGLESMLAVALAFVIGGVVGYYIGNDSNETYTRDDM